MRIIANYTLRDYNKKFDIARTPKEFLEKHGMRRELMKALLSKERKRIDSLLQALDEAHKGQKRKTSEGNTG